MNTEQFDLFSVPAKPATANVVPFPLWRREKTIRAVARTLHNRKTAEGKQSYWVRTIRALKAELATLGCDGPGIDRQAMAFRSCVAEELARLQEADGPPPPPGAKAGLVIFFPVRSEPRTQTRHRSGDDMAAS